MDVKRLFEGEFEQCCCTRTKHGWIKNMGVKTVQYPTEKQIAEFHKRCEVIASNFDGERLFPPMIMKLIRNKGYTMMFYIDTEKSLTDLKAEFGWDFWTEGETPKVYWDYDYSNNQ